MYSKLNTVFYAIIPHGLLIPHIERAIVEVTEDGAFEYRMKIIDKWR